MNILVLNPGSSSLKYGFYDFPEGASLLSGVPSPLTTAAQVIGSIRGRRPEAGSPIDAVGIRVVHGGSHFVKPVRVDETVIDEIRKLAQLAPLHNPIAIKVIEEMRRAMAAVPTVAVFDTAFHQTLPAVASTYAVPAELRVRRYGFHGISYSYVSSRLDAKRQIICHLGNGASVCAIRDGRSVDTSMGFTPMEGLIMGTRAGDLDPGIILYLLRNGMSEAQLDDLFNHRCGLLGVSRRSGDVRELEKAAAGGDERAELALEMFAYRVARYIGAYAVVLGGVDAVTFTAGIGEHSSSMRQRICKRLEFLGVEIDDGLNRAPRTDQRRISRGRVEVWVIPTNEELEIARMTYRELSA